jgi:cytochrome c-type biogenesis protein
VVQVVETTVASGTLPAAVALAAAAGLLAFASPCVLPLVPGYLAYVTGLTGADLGRPRRGRVAAGSALFVLGFVVVFTAYGALFGGLGQALVAYRDVLSRVLGIAVVVLGLGFLGLGSWLQRERSPRPHVRRGLVGAPLLGAAFGVGWTPCIGPTLGAVQALAFTEASVGRGALLSVVYGLGLGLPVILVGTALRGTAGGVELLRRHRLAVMRTGGVVLVVLGLLLVTGTWDALALRLQVWTTSFQPAL